jgi:hypothetical protein
MGEGELQGTLWSHQAESVCWDSRSQATAALTELDVGDVILGFGSGGPNILLR